MKIMIRSRMAYTISADPHGEPWEAAFLTGAPPSYVPRMGEQFITPDDRAFVVDIVEWRYDLGELHLLCSEFPREPPPKTEAFDA